MSDDVEAATRARADQSRKFFEEVALEHVNTARRLVSEGHDINAAWEQLFSYIRWRATDDVEAYADGLAWVIGAMALALARAIELDKPADPRGWTYHINVNAVDVKKAPDEDAATEAQEWEAVKVWYEAKKHYWPWTGLSSPELAKLRELYRAQFGLDGKTP